MNSAPLSSKYINLIAEKILEPIKRGESAFIRWMPGHGKTVLLNEIFTDNKILEKYLGKYFRRYIIVRIDGYLFGKSKLNDLLQYILTTLIDSLSNQKDIKLKQKRQTDQSSIILTKHIIENCQEAIFRGYEIVFVIDAIDDFSVDLLKEMFTFWEYIVESNRERIHTHFNVNKRDIIENCVKQSGLLQNIITISLPDDRESSYFMDYYAKKWEIKITQEQTSVILRLCGHDPVLIKESVRIMSRDNQTNNDFLSEPTLLLKVKNNFNLYGDQEKEVIEQKIKKNNIPLHLKKIADELVRFNFWDKKFNPPLLFEQLIIESSIVKELFFDKKRKLLFFGEIDLSRKLSRSEYKILLKLFNKLGKTTSRDEIAEAIWSDKMLDRYSDWAIDKAIFRLRKKLSQLSFFYHITTKKKEGFKLEI